MAGEVARRLGIRHLDTGALYRAVGYAMTGSSTLYEDGAAKELLKNTAIEASFTPAGDQKVILDRRDITSEIRTPEAAMAASRCSALPSVREYLLDLQRQTARRYDVVMDGRDIGTVVLPGADVKIYLTASPEVRAKRRYEELIGAGKQILYKDVLDEIEKRDYNDIHRVIAPLRRAEDARLVDSSELTFGETVAEVLNIIRKVRV